MEKGKEQEPAKWITMPSFSSSVLTYMRLNPEDPLRLVNNYKPIPNGELCVIRTIELSRVIPFITNPVKTAMVFSSLREIDLDDYTMR